MSEQKTVSFVGTCPARSGVTLVSKRIQTAFRLMGIAVRFASGCNNLLRLHFYWGLDSSGPGSVAPGGVSLLRDYGQVDYVVGEGESKWLEHGLAVDAGGSYLKVYAENDDWYDHAVDVQMFLEID